MNTSKKKSNVLPDFKHTPPEKLTVDQTKKQIITLLGSHKPADQNTIVLSLLGMCVNLRHEEYEAARNAEREAGANFEKLMATAKDIDSILKEIAESKAKGNDQMPKL